MTMDWKSSVQRGFSLVSAIFLLVVMAVLGAAMMNLSVTQHIGSALDMQGARAYQAARAGIEWGMYRTLRQATCAGGPTSFSPPAPGMNGLTVTVTCNASAFAAAAQPITIYRIQSVACNQPISGNCTAGGGGGTNFVQRVIEVQVEQ